MTSQDPVPASPRRGHTDILGGDWIDRHAPAALRPYLRLARLDRPIGTWLLLFPCWWSAALAAEGMPDLWLMALFAIGAVVMRGAGCTVNDILDRDFDARVERTRGRPIPSGQVGVGQALAFLVLLLLAGLAVLVQLDPLAVVLGAASLLLVFTYPLMKRITWWPQAFLGLTFNWGALLAWAAVRGTLDLPALLLYAGGLFWTLGYDTIYAHQDKEDDVLIGVKSSALRLGGASPFWIQVFYALAGLLFLAAGFAAGLPFPWWPVLFLPALLQLLWQARAWRMDDPADCLAKFRSNRWFGWLMLAAILAANTFSGPS
jgi:4-hydroxybenzoate polyprenyltransferase